MSFDRRTFPSLLLLLLLLFLRTARRFILFHIRLANNSKYRSRPL